MGVLNKLKFWKKDDDFNFDSALDKEMANPDPLRINQNAPNLGQKSVFDPAPVGQAASSTDPFAAQPSSPHQPSFAVGGPSGVLKNPELDLLSSKLDTIKAQLSSIEQRLVNIERIAGVQQKPRQRLW